ncbi:MAG: VTT domain-containing protein [Alphaproteobacteria bacterium]|nr:VTT domain-containing protein [Alphaproteobacteria bacterium]
MTRLRPYLRGLVLIAVLVAFGLFLKKTGFYGLVDETWIDQQVRGKGITGEVLFVLAGMAMTAVGFPRQAISFLAGYGFGLGGGTALALAATVLGCMLTFSFARVTGRAYVLNLVSGRGRRIDAFLHDNPFSTALLIRLLPVGSNLVTNLAAGVSGVRALPFFAGSGLGFVPQTVIFALLGSGLHLDPALRISVAVILFLLCGALGIYLLRRYRRGLAMEAEIGDPIPTDSPTEMDGR